MCRFIQIPKYKKHSRIFILPSVYYFLMSLSTLCLCIPMFLHPDGTLLSPLSDLIWWDIFWLSVG